MGSKSAKPADRGAKKTTKAKTTSKKKGAKRAVRKSSAKRGRSKGKQKATENSSKKTPLMSRSEIDQLIINHQDHGKRLAWSFLSSWRIRLPQDEVVSVVGAALCEAANRFDPTRGVDFKTFFFYHLRGMLLKEISRVIQEQKILHFVPHTVVNGTPTNDPPVYSAWAFPIVDTNNPEKIMERRQVASRCWQACSQLDPLEQEVLVRFFGYDEPLVRIAKELNYCRCHISRVKSRALSKLGKLLAAFSTASDGSIDELKLSRPKTRKSKRRRRSSYTGGRGRRRAEDVVPKKSEALQKLLEQVG